MLQCPICKLHDNSQNTIKTTEVIHPWYEFHECQRCGLIIVEKTISRDFEDDRFFIFDQEQFKGFREALRDYIDIQQLEDNFFEEARKEYIKGIHKR